MRLQSVEEHNVTVGSSHYPHAPGTTIFHTTEVPARSKMRSEIVVDRLGRSRDFTLEGLEELRECHGSSIWMVRSVGSSGTLGHHGVDCGVAPDFTDATVSAMRPEKSAGRASSTGCASGAASVAGGREKDETSTDPSVGDRALRLR